MMKLILNKIKDLLDVKKIKYYCDTERGILAAMFPTYKTIFEVGSEVVEFRMIFDKETAEERQEAVREYVNYVNCVLKEGHLEMDGQGVVQFRICTDISEEQDISSMRLFFMMKRASDVEDAFCEYMYQVSDGLLAAKEAFECVVKELSKAC